MTELKQLLYDRRAPKVILAGIVVALLLLVPVLTTDRQALISSSGQESIRSFSPITRRERWPDVPVPKGSALYLDLERDTRVDVREIDQAAEQIIGFPVILRAFDTKGGSYERMILIEEVEENGDYRQVFQTIAAEMENAILGQGWVAKDSCVTTYQSARASLRYCLLEKKTDEAENTLLYIAAYSRDLFIHVFYRVFVPSGT